MGYDLYIRFIKRSSEVLLENASLDNVTVIGGRDGLSPRIRYLQSGTVTIYGKDYRELLSAKQSGTTQVFARIVENITDTEIFSGTMSLLGRWKEASNVCELGLSSEDNYTRLLQSWDVDLTSDSDTTTILRTLLDYRVKYQMRAFGEGTVYSNEEWSPVGQESDSIVPLWNPQKCYKATRVYEDNRGVESGGASYVGDLDSFMFTRDGSRWACIVENVNVEPRQTDGWESYWKQTHPRVHVVGQTYAKVYFANAYYDPQDKFWVRGAKSGTITWQDWPIDTIDLFSVLQRFLVETDPSITINENDYFPSLRTFNPNIGRLVIFRGTFPTTTAQVGKAQPVQDLKEITCAEIVQEPMITMTLEDLIKQVCTMFNVDWYLTDTNEFRFIHPSEDCRDIPAAGSNNDLKTKFGKDWSSEDFLDNVEREILSESLIIGSVEDTEPSFRETKITYQTPYRDTLDYSTTTMDVDIATVWRNLRDSIVIIGERPDGVIYYTATTHNSYLSPYDLLTTYWTWDRPYLTGNIIEPTTEVELRFNLFRKRDSKTTITIPSYHPTSINFRELLSTNYGDLQPIRLNLKLSSSTAEIEAGKE